MKPIQGRSKCLKPLKRDDPPTVDRKCPHCGSKDVSVYIYSAYDELVCETCLERTIYYGKGNRG